MSNDGGAPHDDAEQGAYAPSGGFRKGAFGVSGRTSTAVCTATESMAGRAAIACGVWLPAA